MSLYYLKTATKTLKKSNIIDLKPIMFGCINSYKIFDLYNVVVSVFCWSNTTLVRGFCYCLSSSPPSYGSKMRPCLLEKYTREGKNDTHINMGSNKMKLDQQVVSCWFDSWFLSIWLQILRGNSLFQFHTC